MYSVKVNWSIHTLNKFEPFALTNPVVCVRVCVRARARVCVCVCVCVRERVSHQFNTTGCIL